MQPQYLHLARARERFKANHGLEGIADGVGTSAHVIRNKFNWTQKHKLSDEDVVTITRHTGDSSLLAAMALECNLVQRPLAPPDDPHTLVARVIDLNAHIVQLGRITLGLMTGGITRRTHHEAVELTWKTLAGVVLLINDIETRWHSVPALAATPMCYGTPSLCKEKSWEWIGIPALRVCTSNWIEVKPALLATGETSMTTNAGRFAVQPRAALA